MNTADRRKFLKLVSSGAAAGMLPPGIARALDIPAARRTGTIADVGHVIILTQENRSFDHYFGTLRGVRGFADPRAVTLPSGKPVWYQPGPSGDVLPFRPPVADLGKTFLPDPPHGWNDTHAAWNGGQQDSFVPNKGLSAMTYHTRADIPYHFALAEAFTVCDAYHCSLMGPTDPNRYHLWSGWTGNDGRGGGPVITNAELGYDWTSFPERLQAAGVTWKVYQDIGDGLDAAGSWGWTGDPFIGNYGDNALLYLHQYQYAQPGEPLADRAKSGTQIKALDRDPHRLFDRFRNDVRTGQLPQVSWIAAPEAFTEHPNFPADYGAWYISQLIDILTAHPQVWSQTVLLIQYDEEGGFFDHMVPPTPAWSAESGASTVDTTLEIYPGDATHPSAPYGLGMRVPMLVVSPWSTGGWVNSQVFDHTSVIRFLEARFGPEHPGLFEPNITPWRRAVVGDLTSAFDFSCQAPDKRLRLPSTAADIPATLERSDDDAVVAPAIGALPRQERGVRPARALPYDLHAHGNAATADGSFQIQFDNTGTAAAVFHVRALDGSTVPRSYTVEAGKQLTGVWAVKAAGRTGYHLAVHGPNGFFRGFRGSLGEPAAALIDVRVGADGQRDPLTLTLRNLTRSSARITVVDHYTGRRSALRLDARQTQATRWPLGRTVGWYDLSVSVEGDASFDYRLAGHIEDGEHSVSDPAMASLRIDD